MYLYFDHDARTPTFFVIIVARAEKPLLYTDNESNLDK